MSDAVFLARAVSLSKQSPEAVGCGVVIVQHGKVVAAEYNSQKADGIAVHHAEIKAIIAANKHTRSRTLPEATAYCSCEPCTMCLTALSYAKIPRVVFYKKMSDLFPDDPQSQFDSAAYARTLNFVLTLEQLSL